MTSNQPSDEPFGLPSRQLLRREGARAMLELGQFWAAFPRLAMGPRGDGHTVLVVPGFTANDTSTVPLRTLLTTRGYRAEPWQLGGNIGPSRRILDGMTERLRELSTSSGRKVSLVGWSLGGILARDLARRFPNLVRQVISLGSPFLLDGRRGQPRHTHPERLYQALRPLHSADFVRARAAGTTQQPLPVPATAIYTRTDGVVPWQACLEPDSPTSESVAVSGSHCGLGHNPAAAAIILDRLALPEGTWRRYESSRG
jgi:pimeloyl-ACP methyl ester carboxylesterase